MDEFKCKVCGKECPTAPADGSGAICEEHCEDHQYIYDKWRRGKFCEHCDKEIPYDYYSD